MAIPRDTLLNIVQIGIHAVSGYNGQPWRFGLRDDGIDIYLIRTKNFFMKLEGISYMELGAVIENLREGAAYYGFDSTVNILSPVLGPDAPTVAIKLRSRMGPRPDIQHVLDRHTNRSHYSDIPLSLEQQKKLTSLASDPNVEIHFSTHEEKNRLVDILTELEGIRFSNYYLIREAAAYLRFDPAEVERYRDLLDVRTLPMDARDVKTLKRWRRSSSRLLFYASLLAGRSRSSLKKHRAMLAQSGTLISFVIKDRDYQNFIRLGILIQRFLNHATREGFASMSILSGLYLFDVLRENEEIFSRQQAQTILRLKADLQNLLNLSESKVAFTVRMGIAAPCRVKSLRKNIQDFLIQ